MATTLHHPRTTAELRKQQALRDSEGDASGTYFVVVALIALLTIITVYFVVTNVNDLSGSPLFGQYTQERTPVRWSGQGI